jgi:DNA invertase Pin-like site-specific DNA recombinase
MRSRRPRRAALLQSVRCAGNIRKIRKNNPRKAVGRRRSGGLGYGFTWRIHCLLPCFYREAGQERAWYRGAAQAVATYLNGGNWRIIAEFTEIESGKRSDRPALDKALAAARVRQVPLVVAKVDRLTRSVAFLSRLLEAGVDVRFADLPMIEGATGKFLLQQMAAVAELEAGMISARTKAALAAAKRRGVKLGGDRGARLTAKARAAGRTTLQERARSRAVDLAPTIKELQAAGCESLGPLRRAWRSVAFLRRAGASGQLSRCPDCWRRPALSTQAPPRRKTQRHGVSRLSRI